MGEARLNQVQPTGIGTGAPIPAIEGFQIISLLGSGGMSTVYKACQLSLGRTVAIKVLSPALLHEPGQIQRFLREAKLATRLSHPNIASVLSCGTTEVGLPYLVMEYLQGATLKELLEKQGTLKADLIKQIFGQICGGLMHAHAHKVIHRDLKPANIMLLADGEHGQVKILDFGIAKVIEQANKNSQRLTRTGQVLGSPAYMSPEQFLGTSLDGRCDVYSLGCMLFEALTGKLPFDGNNSLELASKHVGEAAPTLSQATGRLQDVELEAIVATAMAKRPADRFQTVEQFNDKLQSAKWQAGTKNARRRLQLRFPAGSAVPLSLAAAVLMVALAYLVPLALTPAHSDRLAQAEKLLRQGNYLQAFPLLKKAQQSSLNDADASALVDDFLDVSNMTAEDVVPNDKLSVPGDWDLGLRIALMAGDPAGAPSGNHPAAFQLCKAKLIAAWHAFGSYRKRLLDKSDIRSLSGSQRDYCLSLKYQIEALHDLDQDTPDLAAARGDLKQSLDFAQRCGQTGRLLTALLALADFYTSQHSLADARNCLSLAYRIMSQRINSADLETGAALSRLGLIASQASSSLYDPQLAKQALTEAQKVYAQRQGSQHAMSCLYRAQAQVLVDGGNFQQAFVLYQKAATAAVPLADQQDALVGQALCLRALGNRAQAIRLLELVEATVANVKGEDRRRRDLVIISPVLLANYYAESGRAADALRLYDKYLSRYQAEQLRTQALEEAYGNYVRLRNHRSRRSVDP